MRKGKERLEFFESLRGFITGARKNGYAGDGQSVKPPLVEGSTQHDYRQGDYLYRDIYLSGENNFAGQEIVYQEDKPIWGMVYYGAVDWSELENLRVKPAEEEIWNFLKKALLEKSDQVRFGAWGVKVFRDWPWDYVEEGKGTKVGPESDFEGEETIKYNGRRIYKLRYQGGAL